MYWYFFIGLTLIGLITAIAQNAEQKNEEMWKEEMLAYAKRAEARWEKDTALRQKLSDDKLTAVAAHIGDDKSKEELIAISKALIGQLVSVSTGPAVDEFFASLPAQKKMHASLAEANKTALTQYQLRFQPVYDFVLDNFDRWIFSLKERGIWKSEENLPSVAVAAIGFRQHGNVRRIQLTRKVAARVFATGGRIDDGVFNDELGIHIFLEHAERTTLPLFSLTLQADSYHIQNPQPNKFPFQYYQGIGAAPFADEKFIKLINISMNQVMSHVVLEASADDETAEATR